MMAFKVIFKDFWLSFYLPLGSREAFDQKGPDMGSCAAPSGMRSGDGKLLVTRGRNLGLLLGLGATGLGFRGLFRVLGFRI